MAILYHVLLSILPSPVVIHFSSSQQLVWVIGFSAYRLLGRGRRGVTERREAAARQFAGRGEREKQKDAYSDNDERTIAALPDFTLYL
jgi:hypothetical protein